jgi:hypothetical protein
MSAAPLVVLVLGALLTAACVGGVSTPAHGPAVAVPGVEVTAAAGAWRGWPSTLPRLVTPIHVTLANRGAVPVRVDVTSFVLALPDGGRLAAVLPADVRAVVAERPRAEAPGAGVTLGPTREGSGAGWAVNEPALDPRADPTLEPERRWELPSADMVALALPEGVVPPGETVRGFVYFERGPPAVGPVTLVVPLQDATREEPLGPTRVPLTLR